MLRLNFNFPNYLLHHALIFVCFVGTACSNNSIYLYGILSMWLLYILIDKCTLCPHMIYIYPFAISDSGLSFLVYGSFVKLFIYGLCLFIMMKLEVIFAGTL